MNLNINITSKTFYSQYITKNGINIYLLQKHFSSLKLFNKMVFKTKHTTIFTVGKFWLNAYLCKTIFQSSNKLITYKNHKSQLVSILEKKNTLVTIKSVQASSKPNTKSFIIQRNLNKNKKSSITFKITISINLYGFLVVFKKLVIGMIYIQISEPILG